MTSKRSEMMKARWANPKWRAKYTKAIRNGMHAPEARQKATAIRKGEEMIVVTHGTTYITAEAFQDRLYHLGEGKPFTYATGDLASASLVEKDARDLRRLVQTLADQKKIALTQRRRPDLKMRTGLAAFEYIATKRAAIEQALNPRKSRDQTEKQPA